jgi:hypothetical protein
VASQLEFLLFKLIGGFFMIVHTIQWIFGLLLSLILLLKMLVVVQLSFLIMFLEG